jgi:hypothetical protein
MNEITKTDIISMQTVLNAMQVRCGVEEEKMATVIKNIDRLWNVIGEFEKRINEVEKKFFALISIASLAQMVIIPLMVRFLTK